MVFIKSEKIKNIDTPIIDILERFNKLGYRTICSCCGFDYPEQGVRDHTCPYISFYANFKKTVKLRKAIKGWWRLEYLGSIYGKHKWKIERGCEHDFTKEKERLRFQKANKGAWEVIRRALNILERDRR